MVRLIDFEVPKCPRCDSSHRYKLKLLAPDDRGSDQKVLLFGGGGSKTEVLFNCLEKNISFTYHVPTPADSEVAGVATPAEVEIYAKEAVAKSPLTNEFSDWIKNSRAVAVDYCRSMVTTSSAAIPIYFSILKFLGYDGNNEATATRAMVLPPILFFIGAIIFVLALRPSMKGVSESEFSAFRSSALIRLNRMMLAGTVYFLVAVAFSIVIFARVV
jgi:hypothetical protein